MKKPGRPVHCKGYLAIYILIIPYIQKKGG